MVFLPLFQYGLYSTREIAVRSDDFFDPLGSGQICYMTDNHIFITLLLCQEVHSKGCLGSDCCSSLLAQYTDIQ